MSAPVARSMPRFVTAAAIAAVSAATLTQTARPLHCEEEQQAASTRRKLSIYPAEDPKVEAVPVQTELERQIGSARRSVSHFTAGTTQSLRGLVDEWISVERSVEREVKTLLPESEPLTPGLLYVGVATLAGSIFTRYRAWPIRVLTPPLALAASLSFFQPQLSHNVGQYYVDLERKHAPALTRQREALLHESRKYVNRTTHTIHDLKDKTEAGVRDGLHKVESSTGLRVSDVVAGKEHAKQALADQMKAV